MFPAKPEVVSHMLFYQMTNAQPSNILMQMVGVDSQDLYENSPVLAWIDDGRR
jgi:hypothetical protein